jgi:hypothetical protein
MTQHSDPTHRTKKQAQKIAHPNELQGEPVRPLKLTPGDKKRVAEKTPVMRWKKGQ